MVWASTQSYTHGSVTNYCAHITTFKERDLDGVGVRHGAVLGDVKELADGSRVDAGIAVVALHRVCLARARLPVGDDAGVVA